ncbi:MAG: hypothetical protein H7X74_06130, partial [Methyloceanibacter sp.]|nr:hypothetical protein [Methyloceanibacter sp.]
VTVSGLIVLSAWLLIGGGAIRIVWPDLWLVAVTGIFFALANPRANRAILRPAS